MVRPSTSRGPNSTSNTPPPVLLTVKLPKRLTCKVYPESAVSVILALVFSHSRRPTPIEARIGRVRVRRHLGESSGNVAAQQWPVIS
jgi:hypothetical protein